MEKGYEKAKEHYKAALEEIKKIKGNIAERIISSPQGAEIVSNKRPVLNFSANNYLSYTHPPTKE